MFGLFLEYIKEALVFIIGTVKSSLDIDPQVAINRREKIYEPILKELEEIKVNINSNSYKVVESIHIEELVTHNYKYVLDKNLLKKLGILLEDLAAFNKINEIWIAREIIHESFKNGFKDLYGDIIEGYSMSYNEITGEEDRNEIIAKEVEYFYVTDDFIKDFLKYSRDYSIYHDYDVDGNHHAINIHYELARLYEAFLDDNKEVELTNWKIDKGVYISYYYDFNKQYDQHPEIIDKNKYREKILNQVDIIIDDTKKIIESNFKKYEKKGLK